MKEFFAMSDNIALSLKSMNLKSPIGKGGILDTKEISNIEKALGMIQSEIDAVTDGINIRQRAITNATDAEKKALGGEIGVLIAMKKEYAALYEEKFKLLPVEEEVIEAGKAQLTVMQELEAELKKISNMSTLMGVSYDSLAERTSAYSKAIENLAAEGKGVTAQMLEYYSVLKRLQDLKEFAGIEKIIGKGLGVPEPLGYKTTTALEGDNWVSKLVKDKPNLDSMVLRNKGIEEAASKYKEEGEKIFNINLAIGKSIQDVFQGMQGVITEALSSTENVFQAFGKFFGDFIKGMIFKLIAATIAALALVLVISLIPGMGGLTKGFGSIQKALDSGNFGKALLGGLGVLSGGASLASGGIVHDGYSNDTYRANLSSQEAVIPLERLPQLIGIGAGSNGKKVEFFIEGRYLKGILEDAQMMGGIK
jgi:prefoldin subunit 5